PALERVAARGVEQRDFHARAAAVDLAENGFEAEAVAAHVGLGPDLRVDRQDVALPRRLNAKAAEEDQRGGAWLDAAVEFIECAPHGVAGEILADLDVEAVALQLVGEIAGVIDRFF